MKTDKVIIYVLKDPRSGKVRYVGKTVRPLNERLKRHLKEKNLHTRKFNWIRSLKAIGLVPVIELVEICSISNWESREQSWITYYKKYGHELTNSTDGGDGSNGCDPSQYTRKLLLKSGMVARGITEQQILSIANDCRSYKDIAEDYKMTIGAIQNIKVGRFYSSITGIKYTPKDLTDADKTDVLNIFNDKRTVKMIAEDYHISEEKVYKIKSGYNYSNLTGKVYNKTHLSDEQVMSILCDKREVKVIAAEFSVSGDTVRGIKSGRSHSHITGVLCEKKHLTKDAVIAIYNDDRKPHSLIAKDYGVSESTISFIKTGRSHSLVTGHKAHL